MERAVGKNEKLERAVGKNEKLESFKLESLKLESFAEVGKCHCQVWSKVDGPKE